MIDIHSHILPETDDGARDLNEALAMARIAAQDGITHLFATPHHKSFQTLSRQEVAHRVTNLQASLAAAGIDLIIVPGFEVRLEPDMFEDWQRETAGPLGHSRYVLTEPFFHQYDRHMEAMLFEMFERGYIPVMAHPERIQPIQENLSLIEPFLKRGGLTQITAHSLTGYHGERARLVALTMLREGLVHILASDAHHAHRRPPVLSAGVEVAATIVGEAQAQAMVTTTPLAIVIDQRITTTTMVI